LAENKSSMKSLRAYEKIRDMILSGVKRPGTRLILSELEDELGIGRGPIREALMRLDRSGLVKNIPYKGAVVATPPTLKEILHIYDLRVDLEVKLALEAMAHLTEADYDALESLLDTMETLPKNRYNYDRQFHSHIYEASQLPHLVAIAQNLILSVESVLNIYRWDADMCQQFNREHRAVLEALKAGNRDAVRDNLAQNIKNGLDIINETYSKMVRIP